jgi:hypothetical protein
MVQERGVNVDVEVTSKLEALKPAVITGLTSTVARQVINGCMSLVRNIWSKTCTCKNGIVVSTESKESGDVAPS